MSIVTVEGLAKSYGAQDVFADVSFAIARGDKIVWTGHATWRNVRTLRVVDGPKVDVWTVRDGLAVHFLEMFDSYGTARALGIVDPPEAG